ncbi:hypothetical protein B0H13DRAFT_2304868 [Mycena leptocephala]|nr:hypothetical protein B0H13DRAFT_2304868 [Mycena leptocephala]
MSDVVSNLITVRDGETAMEEDPIPLSLQQLSSKDNDDKSSSGEEVSFEDPSLRTGEDLKGRVTQDDQYPFASGGNSNIYRGKLTRDGRKIRVV